MFYLLLWGTLTNLHGRQAGGTLGSKALGSSDPSSKGWETLPWSGGGRQAWVGRRGGCSASRQIFTERVLCVRQC